MDKAIKKIRVTEKTHKKLKVASAKNNLTMGELIDKLLCQKNIKKL
jgi:hypothetical protein